MSLSPTGNIMVKQCAAHGRRATQRDFDFPHAIRGICRSPFIFPLPGMTGSSLAEDEQGVKVCF
jgi:hypothetical protein